MNLEELKEHIKYEEGIKYEIYNDSLGYKTFGVGHLVRASDPENNMEVGTEVSKERVDECFDADLQISINDAETEKLEIMNVEVPTKLNDVDTKLLNPAETWSSKIDYDKAARELAAKFKENIDKFDISDKIRQAGPII